MNREQTQILISKLLEGKVSDAREIFKSEMFLKQLDIVDEVTESLGFTVERDDLEDIAEDDDFIFEGDDEDEDDDSDDDSDDDDSDDDDDK